MRKLGILALGIVALIVGAVLFYKGVYPTYSYRYRMTVEVTVDGVVHSGSSVIEVSIRKQPQVGDAPPIVAYVRGEAVFVDLGKGRNVIALLASGSKVMNVDYPAYVVSQHFKLSTVDDWDLMKYSELRGRWDLPDGLLPNLVTFTNINDPKTARMVKPSEFEQVFGSDVHFKRVEIEMTTDPVTRGIFQKLQWLAGLKGYTGGQFEPDWSRPEKI
jgi:hypothetical protein